MKIMVINPNASASMTGHMEEVILDIKRPETEVEVVHLDEGPETLECSYDKALAVPHMLELVRRANEEDYDAVIIAAFCDPGLTAAKEISHILVLGLEEVTLHMAAILGSRFAILSMTDVHVAHKYQEVHEYKLSDSLASIRALGLTVAETDAQPELTKQRGMEAARRAVEEDGAEVIVLGCAGMAGYAREIEEKLEVTVLDPTSLTFKICEAMAESGIVHSKRAFYALPPEKLIK